MPDPCIACTLSPDGLTARLALIDALAADGLLDRAPTASGLRVRLRDKHQLDESRTGVAVVAIAVVALHLAAAAISGRLAMQAPATP